MRAILLIFLLNIFQKPSYIKIPIDFSSGFPVMQVQIEEKTYPLTLDLEHPYELGLSPEILKQISAKEWMGEDATIDLQGVEKKFPKYLLQRVRLGNGAVIHPIVKETDRGIIGRNILQTCNLFFDFRHSLFFILKDFNDLKTEGYSKKDSVEIPFEMTQWGAVFTIETDFGSKRFFLNTHDPSAIRKPSGLEDKKVTTSKFEMGGIDLGVTTLDLLEISHANIDGFLGLDFFKENAIYLDFQNKKALLFHKL